VESLSSLLLKGEGDLRTVRFTAIHPVFPIRIASNGCILECLQLPAPPLSYRGLFNCKILYRPSVELRATFGLSSVEFNRRYYSKLEGNTEFEFRLSEVTNLESLFLKEEFDWVDLKEAPDNSSLRSMLSG